MFFSLIIRVVILLITFAVNADSSQQLFKYKFLFLEAAQLYITNKTELNTPLRVQRLHVRNLLIFHL